MEKSGRIIKYKSPARSCVELDFIATIIASTDGVLTGDAEETGQVCTFLDPIYSLTLWQKQNGYDTQCYA